MKLLTTVIALSVIALATPAEASSRGEGQLIAHPAGCPKRAFCGCGASVYLFGKPIRELFLAANWKRFQRTAPAPKMAAARYGHVMVLEEHRGGDNWLVTDYNSGGHLSHRHVRSIRGYTIHNPKAYAHGKTERPRHNERMSVNAGENAADLAGRAL
jgi:hypothetical protein